MGLFREIAEPLIAKNIPVVPLRPKTKIAFMLGWERLASVDPKQIQEWDEQYPNANAASVAYAKPGGTLFFEVDRKGLIEEIEKETGQKFPATMMVRSSENRGHAYFRQSPASIALGNCQAGDDKGEVWSLRSDARYVVSPKSFHPTSGKTYELLRDVDPVDMPDWLVEWCKTHRTGDEKHKVNASIDGPEIPKGSHDTELFRIGCLLRNAGMDYEQIKDNLIQVCEKRCVDHGSDFIDMCERKAKQACRYPVGQASSVLIGGVPVGTVQASQEVAIITPLELKPTAYPQFPLWCFKGTSLYDGFVEPICRQNSRYPEFVMMPAIIMMLNYLALKVEIAGKRVIPSFWMVSIGRKGRVIKSSSVNDAIEYLTACGIVAQGGSGTRTADGRSLIWSIGSTEGLGMEMTRTNCKNAVLFFDELGTLASKAGIENSSMKKHLLTMYESGQFSNTVKSRKENFDFAPRSYCTSLIACTTDKNFRLLWSKVGGSDDGMDDRFFFLYQPEILSDLKPYVYVNTLEGVEKTKQNIAKALDKRVYEITDDTLLEKTIGELGNRAESRLEKLALYFAVDMGKDEIDESCLERAYAIVKYEHAAKKYLKAFEATTLEGGLQNELIQLLQRNGGCATLRDIGRHMHPERHGTTLWYKVYNGLIRAGWIAETGNGVKSEPKQVVLLRVPEEED